MSIKSQSGKLSILRAHKAGTKYGPTDDQIDAEIIIKFEHNPSEAYGFQLRPGDQLPSHEAMLSLLRDAYFNDLKVTINYIEEERQSCHILFRVWLEK